MVAMTAGTPYSRATMAACDIGPPLAPSDAGPPAGSARFPSLPGSWRPHPLIRKRSRDDLLQLVVRHEAIVGRGGHHEAARNWKPDANQLAEVGAFSASYVNVIPADVFEVQH